MENDLESKSGDEFAPLPGVHPTDEEEDESSSPLEDLRKHPNPPLPHVPLAQLPDSSSLKDPVEPDRKKVRTENSATGFSTGHNQGQHPQQPQMQMQPHMYPVPGMMYPPPHPPPPPMMMMNPQMYGYTPYYNSAQMSTGQYGAAPADKSKRGGENDGKAEGGVSQQNVAATNMAAAAAAAQMYNPYMMQQMQQFQGMMNSFYNRPGYPIMFNNQAFVTPAVHRKGISLALSIDAEMLSEYQLLVRHQLELFEAGPEDVESNTQGRKKQVLVGQVGLRCRHCAPYPVRARGRGAVYYPAKLNGIYQAAQNMAGSHLCQSCQQIPLSVRTELCRLRDRRDNASGGKQYWADGCVALGVFETDGEGLRMKKKASTESKEEDGNEEEVDTETPPTVI